MIAHLSVRRPSFRAAGFSLVELLVSVLVGLLALVFATRLITGAEQNKASALGGSDAMQNGMLAMFSISGDAQQAGFGLNDPILIGCNTRFTDTGGYALASAPRGASATVRPLAPVVIESGGAGPDRISLYSGSSMSGTGTLRVTSDYIGGRATWWWSRRTTSAAATARWPRSRTIRATTPRRRNSST